MTYSSVDAIRWYTRDSFLYRLLNQKALRIQQTHLLFLFVIWKDNYDNMNPSHDHLESILFEVHADPSENLSKPFADINENVAWCIIIYRIMMKKPNISFSKTSFHCTGIEKYRCG